MSDVVDGTMFSPAECGVLAAALAAARMTRELTGLLADYGFGGGERVSLPPGGQAVEDDLLAKCLRGVDG